MERKPAHRIPLTREMITALHEQAGRSGVTPGRLLKNIAGRCETGHAITQAQLYRWMKGDARTICARCHERLLHCWAGLPDEAGDMVNVTPDILETLRAERERTGVAITALLAGRSDAPQGASVKRLANLCQGALARVERETLEYVLALWRALPDGDFVPLTEETIAALRGHIARTGKGPHAILRGAKDKPDKLTGAMVRAWVDGKVVRARKDHLDYVLRLYESPDPGVRVSKEFREDIRREIRRTGVRPRELARLAGIPCNASDHAWENWPPRFLPQEELHAFLAAWRNLPARR